jgi:hypothetical protein
VAARSAYDAEPPLAQAPIRSMATKVGGSPLAPAATISYSSDVHPVKQVASQPKAGPARTRRCG